MMILRRVDRLIGTGITTHELNRQQSTH